jgi:hypothetical protein
MKRGGPFSLPITHYPVLSPITYDPWKRFRTEPPEAQRVLL